MRRPLTYGEQLRYVRIFDDSDATVRSALGMTVDTEGLDPIGVESQLTYVQAGRIQEFVQGSRFRRPKRARDLVAGFERMLSEHAAVAAPEPDGEVTPPDAMFDVGLRETLAAEEVRGFLDHQAGSREDARALPRPFMTRFVRSRTEESQLHAATARALVGEVARASGQDSADIARRLLRTPPDRRFHEAAKAMIEGSGEPMSTDRLNYTAGVMADQMRARFNPERRRVPGPLQQRLQQMSRWKKALFYTFVPGSLYIWAWWHIGRRMTGPLRRPWRRWTSGREGRKAFGAADKVLAQELRDTAGRLWPPPVSPRVDGPDGPGGRSDGPQPDGCEPATPGVTDERPPEHWIGAGSPTRAGRAEGASVRVDEARPRPPWERQPRGRRSRGPGD